MRKEYLILFNKTVQYSVRMSERAQRMRVAVYADGDVVVTSPVGISDEKLKLFVESKKHWISNKLDQKRHPAIKELAEGSDEHFEQYRSQAEVQIARKLKKWSNQLNLPYTGFTVKKHKSRWGSCSSGNKLSFNYKVLFLPNDLQDYIIVHELCHTVRKDHSKFFWALVAKSLPEYGKLRIKLRALS
jgi:predicted metal-dependent hydrolase